MPNEIRQNRIEENYQTLNNDKDLRGKICHKPFVHFEIGVFGQVYLCCSGWLKKPIGNLNENSVDEIFNSKEAKKIRSSILDGSFKYCNHKLCPYIQEESLPSAENRPAHTGSGAKIVYSTTKNLTPKVYNLCYDMSCNLSCPSCRVNKISYTSGPEYERAKVIQNKVIDYVFSDKNKEGCILNITGSGDPFGSKLFRELLFTVNGEDYPNVKINLQTNGVMFTPKYWNKMEKIHNNFHNVFISLDAATEQTYNVTRRGGDWKAVMNNIKFLVPLQRRGHFTLLRLDFVVQTANYKEIPDFIRLSEKLGITRVYFSLVTDWGTWERDEYNSNCIWRKDHPDFDDFINVLKDPIIQNSPNVTVDSGNLTEYINKANL